MTGNEPIRIVVPIACKGTTANEGRSVHIGGCVRCVHWAGARRLYAAHKRVQNAQRARRVYATMHAHVGSPARTLQVWACETMAFSGAGVVLGLAMRIFTRNTFVPCKAAARLETHLCTPAGL